MDFIHKIMNIIVPPIALIMLVSFLPIYLLFKLLLSTIKSIFSEDVAGKVILITGASSGIGEHLAYEYARRGARLALVARRENRLQEVASTAYQLGSPEVIVIRADVSKVEDCKSATGLLMERSSTMGSVREMKKSSIFRSLHLLYYYYFYFFFFVYCGAEKNVLWVFMLAVDHLVNNAGVAPVCMFESITDITNLAPAMDINFWGSVYATYFALPHLKKSKGKIIPIASAAAWLPAPRLGFYNSSKAAVISFYETLRVEFGKDIGLTIVTPGLIDSEMTQGKVLSKEGDMVLDPDMRDVLVSIMPIAPVRECAKAIVDGACRGEKYLTQPAWVRAAFSWKAFCPEILEWSNRLLLPRPGASERDTPSKKLLELTGLKKYIYPDTVQFPEHKDTRENQRVHN